MLRELFGKDFDGDFAPELAVPGAVDFAHATGPEGREDLVGTHLGASLQCHRSVRWNEPRQFFKPVLDEDELRGSGLVAHTTFLDHQETLAVGRHVVVATGKSRNGSELFYLDRGWRLMAVPVRIDR